MAYEYHDIHGYESLDADMDEHVLAYYIMLREQQEPPSESFGF